MKARKALVRILADNERLREELKKWPPLPVITQEQVDNLVAENERLREALRGYHDLMPALADCANECGAALLYSQAHQANKNAAAALGEQS